MLVTGLESEFMISLKKGYKRPFHFLVPLWAIESFSSNKPQLIFISSALQLFAKLQAVKAENQDIHEAHIKERQELEQTQNELTRELKLKYVVRTISVLSVMREVGFSGWTTWTV